MTHGMSSEGSIENLIARHSLLVDDGDFAGLGDLLHTCDFTLGAGPAVRGRDAIVQWARNAPMTCDDGTPRTRHITTNGWIAVDEAAGTATSRSCYTVLQAVADFPLQPIASGTYRDRFERRDGTWFFKERLVQLRFAGDTSRHRRPAPQ